MVSLHKYELLEGKHHEGAGASAKTFKKGDLVETAHPDLCERFPGRFRRLDPSLPFPFPVPAPAGKEKKITVGRIVEDETKVEGNEAALAARGKDVSGNFKLDAQGLKVFSRDGKFFVFEDTGLTPLNEKPLKSAEVEPFVAKWLLE